MIILWEKLEKLQCRIILQIHDELVIECPNEEKVIQEVKECLQQVLNVEAKEKLQELFNENHPEKKQQFVVPLDQSIQMGTDLDFWSLVMWIDCFQFSIFSLYSNDYVIR